MSKDTKNKILKYLSCLLSFCFTFAFGYFAMKIVPVIVSYELSEQKKVNEAGNIVSAEESINVLFENVNQIPDKNGYTVKSNGESIYVFSENTALYKINARLCDFPANDVYLLKHGMEITDKAELYEIICYMES